MPDKKRKPQTCSSCGKPGHRADTCPDCKADAQPKRTRLRSDPEEIVVRIRLVVTVELAR